MQSIFAVMTISVIPTALSPARSPIICNGLPVGCPSKGCLIFRYTLGSPAI
ncbi:MAG: hypothetical protein LBM93_10020 [Oscillospiraceae bacterium]|nr:hypothetical protein [Oscillospiraceae bacterium]